MFPAFAEVDREMYMREQVGKNTEHYRVQGQNFLQDCMNILCICSKQCCTEDITKFIANERVENLVFKQFETQNIASLSPCLTIIGQLAAISEDEEYPLKLI